MKTTTPEDSCARRVAGTRICGAGTGTCRKNLWARERRGNSQSYACGCRAG